MSSYALNGPAFTVPSPIEVWERFWKGRPDEDELHWRELVERSNLWPEEPENHRY